MSVPTAYASGKTSHAPPSFPIHLSLSLFLSLSHTHTHTLSHTNTHTHTHTHTHTSIPVPAVGMAEQRGWLLKREGIISQGLMCREVIGETERQGDDLPVSGLITTLHIPGSLR